MSVPVKITPDVPDVIRRLRERGESWEAVAKAIGVCRTPTLMRYVTNNMPDIYRGHLSRGTFKGTKVKALGLPRMSRRKDQIDYDQRRAAEDEAKTQTKGGEVKEASTQRIQE